jgi:high-affinity nickel permease
MDKIKIHVQKLWLDHKITAIAVIVGVVIGTIIF